MKLSFALALLAAAVPSVIGSGILSPAPGASFQPKETFLFSFDPTQPTAGLYTTNVTVHLQPPNLTVIFPLGVLKAAPWQAKLTLPGVGPGKYELVALETVAYSFTGLPAKTIRHNQTLVIALRPEVTLS